MCVCECVYIYKYPLLQVCCVTRRRIEFFGARIILCVSVCVCVCVRVCKYICKYLSSSSSVLCICIFSYTYMHTYRIHTGCSGEPKAVGLV